MTHLEIVNKLLTRLRERTVGTVLETTYSSLLSYLVNDAKELVEASWNWSGLRNTLSAVTVDDIFAYELNGTQNNLTVLDVINDTDNFFMEYKTAHEFNKLFLASTPEKGSPRFYSFNGISSDGDTQVDVYPIPNGVYDLRFNIIQRNQELVGDSDTLVIPNKPVELLAYAMAIEERGEDGGVSSSSAFSKAQQALGDSVALDSAKHPEETQWYSS
tara:strand:+ start:1791 stop:2438 length:648 start_codon:yes stop_codon:yes gene_type:complete